MNLSAYISGSSIPFHLLPYTRLFLQCIFSLPIEKDGKLIPYEDVVKGLEEDTIYYEADLGTSTYKFKELVVFKLKAKTSKFKNIIQWLKDILWNTRFTAERLKIVATQILGDLPQAKRDGYSVSLYTKEKSMMGFLSSICRWLLILFKHSSLIQRSLYLLPTTYYIKMNFCKK